MSAAITLIVAHLSGFLLGSIPTGYLIARLHGIDIRAHGSGNVGATNVGRALGKKLGVLTLLVDALKGTAAAMLPGALLSRPELAPTVGLLAVCGHCFSPFLKLRGGKGVATGVGVFAVIAPVEAALGFGVFLLVVLLTGYVSLGSMVGALAVPLAAALRGQASIVVLSAFAASLLIVVRHRSNIKRLLRGEESRMGKRRLLGPGPAGEPNPPR